MWLDEDKKGSSKKKKKEVCGFWIDLWQIVQNEKLAEVIVVILIFAAPLATPWQALCSSQYQILIEIDAEG